MYWVELAGINGLPERHSLEWVSVTNGDEDQNLCQDFRDWKSKSTIDGLIAGLTATTRGVMPNIASSPCCLPPIHAQPLGGWKEAGNSQGEGKRGGDEDGTADDEERDGEGEAAEGSAEEARRMFDRGPGCLSIAYGMAEELGLFRIDRDGKTLYLNPYAWNQVHDENAGFSTQGKGRYGSPLEPDSCSMVAEHELDVKQSEDAAS
ncbi:hypothetical protein RHGRI_009481 [Rhododendron griersonianum]|uniref:Uncharacterized protein n=1 Tax=Rhododendron griersonianum TaxID=479676 RepID=A0AAV6KF75_9ERIC|nr:hypothetical protein RHGRI_009481 [Rhododendron griersonianum]